MGVGVPCPWVWVSLTWVSRDPCNPGVLGTKCVVKRSSIQNSMEAHSRLGGRVESFIEEREREERCVERGREMKDDERFFF